MRIHNKNKLISKNKNNNKLNKDKYIDYVMTHKSTNIISYKDYPREYDYVYKKFPFPSIKRINIYNISRDNMNKLGYQRSRGVYISVHDIIFICDISNDYINTFFDIKLDKEDIIVHELLHYASKLNKNNFTRHKEEEFAYKNSIEYLRSKGYSDEKIINNNLLPYLLNMVIKQNEVIDSFFRKKKIFIKTEKARKDMIDFYKEEIFKEFKNKAINLGKKFIGES